MNNVILIFLLLFTTFGLMAIVGHTASAPVQNDTIDPYIGWIWPGEGYTGYFGDTGNIMWDASDTNLIENCVSLWYSVNGGQEYTPIAEGITNTGGHNYSGLYTWSIPSILTYSAKMRIKVVDSFGNATILLSEGLFTIDYVPPAAPEGVNIDVSNGSDAVITWLPVSETIYQTPITPDGYIILFSEYPDNLEPYYFLSETTGLTYTHYRVARFRQQMYYSIVAYKDYSSKFAEILNSAKANPDLKISWDEIKQELQSSAGGVK
jgi:hypothetical protein